jgi:hypothetical protein
LNKHGYSLFAVLAIGEQSNGVPVSFLITKSESTETSTTALKQFVGFLDEVSDTAAPAGHGTLIRPSTTMTDDSGAEQSALRSV